MAGRIHRNSLKPGYELLWYRIENVLGQGGFGITYLAHDFNLDRKAAIKEYLPSGLALRENSQKVQPLSVDHDLQYRWGLDRFLNEARTLAKFEHPNIVRVLNVFEANNTAYMVMSYEEGENFQTILNRRFTLEEGELRTILMALLDGLEKVHKAGFIHRDIKPANIFLRRDGSPVLLDFGSARQALAVHTSTITNLISPGYAPFEQYHSKSDAQGPWTDIYGLSATLYRAVTGVPPKEAVDRSREILKGSGDILPPAAVIGRGRYTEQFLHAIDHGLAFREEDRPEDIAEWKREFGPFTELPAVPESERTFAAADRSGESVPETETERADTGEIPDRRIYRTLQQFSARYGLAAGAALLIIVSAAAAWMFREGASPGQDTASPAADVEHRAEMAREARIRTLLARAEADLQAQRLTLPENDSALFRYRKVLEFDPYNSEAEQGLRAITNRLVILARDATAAEDFTQAARYLDEAAAIDPGSSDIRRAGEELALQRAAYESAVAEIRARQEQAQVMLMEAEAAVVKGDVKTMTAKLNQARSYGAGATAIAAVHEKMRARLAELAAAEMEKARKAVEAGDADAARKALNRTREIKTRAAALAAP